MWVAGSYANLAKVLHIHIFKPVMCMPFALSSNYGYILLFVLGVGCLSQGKEGAKEKKLK